MTESEAKKIILKFCEDIMDFARGKDMSDKELEDFCKFSEALNFSVYSLEEIQQYRAIGTVEECREAREVNQKITNIVNQQLIAGKDNYKEVYDCFYDIVRAIQGRCR